MTKSEYTTKLQTKRTMNKPKTMLIIGLIIISCGNSKHFRIENRYEISNDSSGMDRQLIHQVHYDKKGIKGKEIVYKPSPNIFQKETGFDSKGNKTSEITYFDSAMTTGTEILFRYNDKILTQVLAINNVERNHIDTTIINFTNELDSLNRLIKSVSITENDTNVIEYQYSDLNKPVNVISKFGNSFISYENYYYNDNGQKQEYVLRIPDYSIEKHMIYYYSDTLLTQIISIKNSDTLRIERFDYNEMGLKKNIY